MCYGLTALYGIWNGIWNMEYGIWNGIWNMEYGIWNGYGIRNGILDIKHQLLEKEDRNFTRECPMGVKQTLLHIN